MSGLPKWAEAIVPVDMDGAAACLGISRRSLVDVIRTNKHYDRRGSRKVFYPEHIALLREAIKCQKGALGARGYGLNAANGGSGTPLEVLPDSAFEKALALATKGARPNSKPTSKQGSGSVIPMVRKQSARSRTPL